MISKRDASSKKSGKVVKTVKAAKKTKAAKGKKTAEAATAKAAKAAKAAKKAKPRSAAGKKAVARSSSSSTNSGKTAAPRKTAKAGAGKAAASAPAAVVNDQKVAAVAAQVEHADAEGKRRYTPNEKEKYMSLRQEKYFVGQLHKMLEQIGLTTDKTIDALRVADAATPDENDRASKEADFALELRERERESFLVQKIRHALQRLDAKEFGYCEECGDKIGLKRLLARPVATLCFDCKNLQEYQEKIHS